MLVSTVLTFALLLQPATAPTTSPSRVDAKSAMAAIDRFLANPGPGDDVQTILQFAQESADVEVQVDHFVTPWLGKKPAYPNETAYLISFIAGNVKSQLTNHKRADDALAGITAVLSTYEKYRAKDSSVRVPELDEFLDIQKKGELPKHVQRLVDERSKQKPAGKEDQD